MIKNNKIIKIYLLLLVTFIVINLNIISKANTDEIVLPNETEYSYEYKKWLALPDDEKENYIMPPMYTINLEDNQDISEISLYNINASTSNETIPAKYNLADYMDIKVRNQGITDSCWAIASTEMFEITYAKLKNLNVIKDFSSRHMDYATSRYFTDGENSHGFNRRVGDGSNFVVGMAYLSSGKGPIYEDDMPFINSKDLISISEIQNKKVQAQLRDYILFPNIYKSYDSDNNIIYSNGGGITYSQQQIDSFRNNIKKQIMNYGAVGTHTYAPTSLQGSTNYFSKEEGYNYGNSYFCNNNTLTINHSICIVGWDDNYSKENFKLGCQPANDGAYIALGSWGTKWNSNGGYYYISYDDCFIELLMYGIQNVSNVEYDNIYQYDELGNNYSIYSKYDETNIYGANVFKKQTNSKEKLTDIGLYIYNDNTNVTIYLDEDGNNLNVNNLKVIATASNLKNGYHVIKLDTNTPLIIDNTFSIIVKYNNNNDIAKLPIEANYASLGQPTKKPRYNTATSNPGESYYSLDGTQWKDLYDINPDINICIKAFTVNLTGNANDTNYIKNSNWNLSKGNNVTMLSGIEEKTTITDLLSTNNFSNNYTVKAYKNNIEVTTGIVTTGTVIKIYEDSTEVQQYTIVIYGDTTGDGNISSIDALSIVKNNLGKELFSNEIYEEAGRVTKDKRLTGKTPNAVDALACVKYKLGTGTISQY